jgi:hypothetical protein
MSVDTTMVLAKVSFYADAGSKPKYTAKVVGAAEALLEPEYAYEKAEMDFLKCTTWPWFKTIGRAKTFASLLRQEAVIEYEHLLIIEIVPSEKKVYHLSKRGNRVPAPRQLT